MCFISYPFTVRAESDVVDAMVSFMLNAVDYYIAASLSNYAISKTPTVGAENRFPYPAQKFLLLISVKYNTKHQPFLGGVGQVFAVRTEHG